MICYSLLYVTLPPSLSKYIPLPNRQENKYSVHRPVVSESVSESAMLYQIKQFQFYTYNIWISYQTRHIHRPSPHFSPDFRIDNLKTLPPSQYPIPLISFLKFSVSSFLLTRHASLSYSDERGNLFFFVHAILHILCLSLSLISYFFCCYTSVRPPRSYAKLKLKLELGYARSRVCSGIILLDGCVGVHGWMDEWIISSCRVLEWWTMELMEWVVKTEKLARQQFLLRWW